MPFQLIQPRQQFVSQPLDGYNDDSVWRIRESDTVFQSETFTVGRFSIFSSIVIYLSEGIRTHNVGNHPDNVELSYSPANINNIPLLRVII